MGQRNGKDAAFAPDLGPGPALLAGIVVGRRRQRVVVQIAAIGIARVLDQDARRREGQQIDEAVPVLLGDGRVHDHRAGHAVGAVGLDLDAHEFLETHGQMPRRLRAPPVQDRARLDPGAAGQCRPLRIQQGDVAVPADLGARPDHRIRQRRPVQRPVTGASRRAWRGKRTSWSGQLARRRGFSRASQSGDRSGSWQDQVWPSDGPAAWSSNSTRRSGRAARSARAISPFARPAPASSTSWVTCAPAPRPAARPTSSGPASACRPGAHR